MSLAKLRNLAVTRPNSTGDPSTAKDRGSVFITRIGKWKLESVLRGTHVYETYATISSNLWRI